MLDVIISIMSQVSEQTIFLGDGLPHRPRIADASGSAIIGAVALGLLTRDWAAALAGGVLGAGLANQKQPLELAIREYFKKRNLEVMFFYRAPRYVKVTFTYAPNAFWTVESTVPDSISFPSDEERDDWLYGNLIKIELPKIMRKIRRLEQR